MNKNVTVKELFLGEPKAFKLEIINEEFLAKEREKIAEEKYLRYRNDKFSTRHLIYSILLANQFTQFCVKKQLKDFEKSLALETQFNTDTATCEKLLTLYQKLKHLETHNHLRCEHWRSMPLTRFEQQMVDEIDMILIQTKKNLFHLLLNSSLCKHKA